MVLIAGMGGERLVNTFVRAGMVAITGPAFQTYLLADAISPVLSTLIPGAASGAVVGFVQWMLLPHRLRPARIWLLASVCGGAIAWWAATSLFTPIQHFTIVLLRGTFGLAIGRADILIAALVAGSAVGYLGGAIAGSIQWLILRRVARWTIGWIIINAIGWSSMWAVGALVLAIIALQSPIIVN
jgi:hypothetical protein